MKDLKIKNYWKRVFCYVLLVMLVRNYVKDLLMRISFYRFIFEVFLYYSVVEIV